MARYQPIHIKKLRWQVYEDCPTFIASIGITLANGSKSPMFTGVPKDLLSEIKEIKILEQTKTIVAYKYKAYCATQNLEFRNKKGQ